MSNELYCEKRVVTEEEHQYWMDRTIPFPGVDKKYQARYRMCNRFVTDCDTDGLVNKDHLLLIPMLVQVSLIVVQVNRN